jgi:hypothetical protein
VAPSVMVTAKRSVDETVESYLGRAALFVCTMAAGGFALAGIWLAFRTWFGPIAACLLLALIFAGLAAAIQSIIITRDKRAESALSKVSNELTEATAASPIDLQSVLTYAPAVLPILTRMRSILPIIALAALAFLFWPKDEQKIKV